MLAVWAVKVCKVNVKVPENEERYHPDPEHPIRIEVDDTAMLEFADALREAHSALANFGACLPIIEEDLKDDEATKETEKRKHRRIRI